MRTLGFVILIFSWLLGSSNGYGVEHIAMLCIGVAMLVGSLYLGRR